MRIVSLSVCRGILGANGIPLSGTRTVEPRPRPHQQKAMVIPGPSCRRDPHRPRHSACGPHYRLTFGAGRSKDLRECRARCPRGGLPVPAATAGLEARATVDAIPRVPGAPPHHNQSAQTNHALVKMQSSRWTPRCEDRRAPHFIFIEVACRQATQARVSRGLSMRSRPPPPARQVGLNSPSKPTCAPPLRYQGRAAVPESAFGIDGHEGRGEPSRGDHQERPFSGAARTGPLTRASTPPAGLPRRPFSRESRRRSGARSASPSPIGAHRCGPDRLDDPARYTGVEDHIYVFAPILTVLLGSLIVTFLRLRPASYNRRSELQSSLTRDFRAGKQAPRHHGEARSDVGRWLCPSSRGSRAQSK